MIPRNTVYTLSLHSLYHHVAWCCHTHTIKCRQVFGTIMRQKKHTYMLLYKCMHPFFISVAGFTLSYLYLCGLEAQHWLTLAYLLAPLQHHNVTYSIFPTAFAGAAYGPPALSWHGIRTLLLLIISNYTTSQKNERLPHKANGRGVWTGRGRSHFQIHSILP